MRFEQLQQYKETEGHTRVPKNYPKNPPLGNWVSRQREKKKAGTLQAAQIEQLERIDFQWEIPRDNRPEDVVAWTLRLNELQQYKETEGHTRVPKNYPKNPQLGQWVQHPRKKKKAGLLQNDRIEQLKRIGFQWEIGKGRGRR